MVVNICGDGRSREGFRDKTAFGSGQWKERILIEMERGIKVEEKE